MPNCSSLRPPAPPSSRPPLPPPRPRSSAPIGCSRPSAVRFFLGPILFNEPCMHYRIYALILTLLFARLISHVFTVFSPTPRYLPPRAPSIPSTTTPPPPRINPGYKLGSCSGRPSVPRFLLPTSLPPKAPIMMFTLLTLPLLFAHTGGKFSGTATSISRRSTTSCRRSPPALCTSPSGAFLSRNVLFNLWQQISALLFIFFEFREVSGLTLNYTKCVIVPLWAYTESNVRALLREHNGTLGFFVIANAAKYLGIYLGPASLLLSWQAPLRKYMSRVRDLRQTGLGLLASARLYNIGTLPCLSYLAAHLPLPREALQHEFRALQILTAGPYHAWPLKFLHALKTFSLPVEFTSLHDLALSSSLRTFWRSSTVAPASLGRVNARWTHAFPIFARRVDRLSTLGPPPLSLSTLAPLLTPSPLLSTFLFLSPWTCLLMYSPSSCVYSVPASLLIAFILF